MMHPTLKGKEPQLWYCSVADYYDLAPEPVPASDELRVRLDDLQRYVNAILQIWAIKSKGDPNDYSQQEETMCETALLT